MCGIAGIFHCDGRPVDVTVLKRMADRIRHRGPDGEGFWLESFIGFAHRRLAIIDLSPAGHQPMHGADDSLVLVYNGEIYNFRELRAELEAAGRTFHTRTDTEVVLQAYDQWGEECVHRFNGMFAFALWDRRRHRLFAARDRYGIKPFYYRLYGDTLVFASEIKAILEYPAPRPEVSLPALNEYFSFQNLFGAETLFAGIHLLPAAHTLSLQLGDTRTFRLERYWDFHFRDDPAIGEEEAGEEVLRLFSAAVRRQLVSDVEIGAYLSGGMDSGSITCIAAQQFRHLKTFTCGFDLSSASGLELGFDERGKAEFLSNLYKTEHYEIVLKAGDMERIMPQLVWHLEDLRVGQSYPNFYVARLAGKFVKVVLSGVGGDELFAGYPWRYYRAAAGESYERYLEEYYRYWQRLIPDEVQPTFFQPAVYPALAGRRSSDCFRAVFPPADSTPPGAPEAYIHHSLYFESKTFLHGLLLVEDKLSMAHGLETRVPFLDNDLVDFAMRVPLRCKLRHLGAVEPINENEPGHKPRRFFEKTNDGKLILRRTLARFVPEYYTDGCKQGFSAPDASWFKGESIEYIRRLLFDPRARIYEYIRPDTAQALMEDHFAGRTNRRLLIWSLLCFEWWLRTFLS